MTTPGLQIARGMLAQAGLAASALLVCMGVDIVAEARKAEASGRWLFPALAEFTLALILLALVCATLAGR